MYLPSSFAVSQTGQLHDFIESHSFGILVTQADGLAAASHLPFLLDRESGTQGSLIGHVARANSQWQQAGAHEVLVIFSGPHVYVSPTWYEAELTVPTWNYIAVHVYGRMTLVEESGELLKIVEEMTEVHERSMPNPWRLESPADFIEKLLRQIVGFRIEITRIEGKWKLNQNHPVERRERVVQALNARQDDNSRQIAAAMVQTLAPNGYSPRAQE